MGNGWIGGGRLTRALCNALDRAVSSLGLGRQQTRHIETGQRGEDEAYFHLRGLGYTVVARNWRTARRRGELDMVGWDGGTLCFVEVKTRSSREVKPAEAAVDREKQRELSGMAHEYLRRMPQGTPFRFDVVSVYLEPDSQTEIEVLRNTFR
jgi:putative endonuclease